MRNSICVASAALVLALFLGACQSHHEEGVKSNYMTQWTTVSRDTRATTDASKSVFEQEGLKDVSASSTSVDGKVTGKKADGTKVTAAIKKVSDNSSEVSVNVGSMGDPALGAEMAKKIKMKAEGM